MAEDRQNLANDRHYEPPVARKNRKRTCPCDTFTLSKWCLLIYAVFLLIVGAILIAIGVWAESLKADRDPLSAFLSSPAMLLMVGGILIVIIALVGIISTILEKYYGLFAFLVLLILILLFQVVIGILAFVYREQAAETVGSRLADYISSYKTKNSDKYFDDAIDSMQTKLECCGFVQYKDWDKNEAYKCTNTSKLPSACGVPSSCCLPGGRQNKTCGYGLRGENSLVDPSRIIYLKGCAGAFVAWIDENLDVVGAVALGFAIPQVLGIFLTWNFMIFVDDRRHLYKSTYV